jgi:hypothetical protein
MPVSPKSVYSNITINFKEILINHRRLCSSLNLWLIQPHARAHEELRVRERDM